LGVVPQRIQSHGHWLLQGIARPIELFEVADGNAPFTAPADSAKAYRVVRQGELWQPLRDVRHNLPAERDSFVGRQEHLEVLAKRLDVGARLVSSSAWVASARPSGPRSAWMRRAVYPGSLVL
jgi:hypothetical protein